MGRKRRTEGIFGDFADVMGGGKGSTRYVKEHRMLHGKFYSKIWTLLIKAKGGEKNRAERKTKNYLGT